MISITNALWYLSFVNTITCLLFALDKFKAKKDKWRVPERTLHMLELFGGVLATIVLMYTLRHKCSKPSYYVITYLILAIWILGIILLTHYGLITI